MEGHLSTVCALILVLGAIVQSDADSIIIKVKPGVCPKLPFNLVKKCIHACTNDYQCKGNLKCCAGGCGRVCAEPIRVHPGVCPRIARLDLSLCHGLKSSKLGPICTGDFDCFSHQKCCFSGCGHTCVNAKFGHPGVCPSVLPKALDWCAKFKLPLCSDDSDCHGHQKCCYNGCGRVCTDANIAHPGVCPCAKLRHLSWCQKHKIATCYGDSDCQRHQKCCYNGCGRVCVDGFREKPGVCPYDWLESFKCILQKSPSCWDDFDCPGSYKCCRSKCGGLCVAPRVKQGVCPNFHLNSIRNCKGIVHNGCSKDDDCKGNWKCCKRGCRFVCVKPRFIGFSSVKLGQCPPTVWRKDILCNLSVHPSSCISDKDCDGNLKCCSDQCGNVCKLPVFAIHH